jgi:leukotriene-A4 hydrolase
VVRMKYLKPLYTQLAASRKHRALARSVYERNRERYHPIARQGVEAILSKA